MAFLYVSSYNWCSLLRLGGIQALGYRPGRDSLEPLVWHSFNVQGFVLARSSNLPVLAAKWEEIFPEWKLPVGGLA